MEGIIEGRCIHVVLGPEFKSSEGAHRGARVSHVVDAEQGIIDAHVDLLPADLQFGIDNISGVRISDRLPRKEESEKETDEVEQPATGLYFGLTAYLGNISYSEAKEPRTWHWIERA